MELGTNEDGLSVLKRQLHRITKKDEIGYFAPRTWEFWIVLLVCFCVFSIAGHWLEIPYCWFMDRFFGIVSDDYAIWSRIMNSVVFARTTESFQLSGTMR